MTDRGDDVFRAYSNPIWVTFDGTSVVESGEVGALALSLPRNPFAGATSVEFTARPGEEVTVTVHDVSGRLVKVLHRGRAARAQSVLWDGTDADGRAVASGVYLFRLESRGHALFAKGVLLK
jgi:flagellar hook assembly protein FlgD